MAENVGEIKYEITVDAEGLVTGIKKANEEIDSLGDKTTGLDKFKGTVKSVGAVTAGAVATATAAVGALAKSSVQSYAEFEQLAGGVETLFKDSADTVMNYANQAYKTAGFSANQYMETVTGFSASLLQSLGGDTEKAASIADQAIIDMADNANKMGTSIESIQYAYQGFAKQNYTMLDNLKLGYGGTQAEMQRLLEDASKIAGVKFSIDSFADVTQAIHVMQEQMGIAGTTALEAEETISGSLSSLSASWSNLLTGLSDDTQDFGSLIDNVVKSLSTVIKNLAPVATQAFTGIANLITEIVPIIVEMLPNLITELVPPLMEAVITLIEAVIDNLPTIVDALLNAVLTIATMLIERLPDILAKIVEAVLKIAEMLTKPENLTKILEAAVMLLLAIVQAIPQILSALATSLPEIISNIVAFLLEPKTFALLLDASVQLFLALVQAVPLVMSSLFSAFINLFTNLWNKLQSVFTNFAGKFGEALGGAFKNAINGVLGFIEGFLNTPINAINGLIGVINSIPGVNIGRLSNIQFGRLATGGIVPAQAGGHLILAGEAGEDEWVVPEGKMESLIEQFNQRGTSGGVTINLYGTFATSESEQRRVAEQIYEALQDVNKQRMGAYL